ncbi:hypothetical protein LIER_06104 [Lithospermum erythrorhizon]|uniref:Uncharacterized protein n=1 Tax=Lithospermum erythrorhizon TaxID=34254 RepID=A0AAV3P3B1_LITER
MAGGAANIEGVVLEYFTNIFRANSGSTPELTTNTVDHRVNGEMNSQLTKIITSEEVKHVIFEMPADKSPKGLTCMIREAELRGTLTGIKISRDSSTVSHILFVDDTYIFCTGSTEEGMEVMRITGL